MAPEKAPAFQFYPREFLMDGNVAGMSLQERGAYITLICLCWQERTLPADMTRLARMVGLPTRTFTRLWRALEPCFRVSGDDTSRLIHPRLEKEREKQDAYRQRQSHAGQGRASQFSARAQPNISHGSAERQPEVSSSISDLRTVVVPPVVPRKQRGSICPHEPRCETTTKCIERKLEDGRKARSA